MSREEKQFLTGKKSVFTPKNPLCIFYWSYVFAKNVGFYGCQCSFTSSLASFAVSTSISKITFSDSFLN